MDNQQSQQHFQQSNQMSPQMNHGGHELLDAHEAIGGLFDAMQQSLFYEQHIQDPALKTKLQNHKACNTQLYNTIDYTLQSGQDPSTPTQSYKVSESKDVVYGM